MSNKNNFEGNPAVEVIATVIAIAGAVAFLGGVIVVLRLLWAAGSWLLG